VVAVPVDKITNRWSHVHEADDMPGELMERIAHFFEHYKDLDEGKWVRVEGWAGSAEAREEILKSIQMYQEAPEPKPYF
jgi:inorganic pyrophosphatase